MAVHEHRKLCTQNSVLSRPTVLCNSIINGEIALRNIAFHTFLDDVRKMCQLRTELWASFQGLFFTWTQCTLQDNDHSGIKMLLTYKTVYTRQYERRCLPEAQTAIGKQKNTFCGTPLFVPLSKFCEKPLSHTKYHWNRAIGCWVMAKNDFPSAV